MAQDIRGSVRALRATRSGDHLGALCTSERGGTGKHQEVRRRGQSLSCKQSLLELRIRQGQGDARSRYQGELPPSVRGSRPTATQVGLGTDCSGGPSIGILSAIRSASHTSKFLSFIPPHPAQLSTEELFYLATLGGASLCRLDDTIGNFLPGKEFDALWIRSRSPAMTVQGKRTAARGMSLREVFQKWLWSGDDRDIGAVWVRGKRVAGSHLNRT